MIPYADLVASLRSWRERNGLPNFGVDPASAPVVVKAPPGPAPGGLPRSAPPVAPPRAQPAVVEVEDELGADELESADEYTAAGDDFAVSFGANAESTVAGRPPEPGVIDADRFGAATATFDDDFGADGAPTLDPETVESVDAEDALIGEEPSGGPPKPPGRKR